MLPRIRGVTKVNTNQAEILPKLTPKQQVFLAEYATNFNLTQAVQKAYPNMAYNAARAYGVKLKKTPKISAQIDIIQQEIRENMVLTQDSRSVDLMMWSYSIIGAQQYVYQISDNVKRSIEEKIRKGEWIGQAPIGYLNIRTPDDKSNITIDEFRAPIIRNIFELYATGTHSIRTIKKIMIERGLTNPRTSRPITTAQIDNILNNPFYYGMMRIKGKVYPHRYPPITSEHLYSQCQGLKSGKKHQISNYSSKPFALRGLIKCSNCGCSISFDSKKQGKHVYGMCTQYHGKCGATRVRENDLLDQVSSLFSSIKIPQKTLEILSKQLSKSHEAKKAFHDESIKGLRCEYDNVQQKLDRLLDLQINGSITTDQYDQKCHQLKERQHQLEDQLKAHREADEKFAVTVTHLLSLASRAKELFESSKPEQKQQLIGFVLSNLTLNGKKLQYEIKKPFDALLECAKSKNWLPRLVAIQKFFMTQSLT